MHVSRASDRGFVRVVVYLSKKQSFEHSMLTRSIEGKVKELYTFGRQHVRLWSRALGTAERGATPTGIVLEPATKDR